MDAYDLTEELSQELDHLQQDPARSKKRANALKTLLHAELLDLKRVTTHLAGRTQALGRDDQRTALRRASKKG